uniref:phytol kinase n=1 Tax=Aegilops tauschii subsp. strangulata TaxID=200361 RepID=A0A453SP96_AEGTS
RARLRRAHRAPHRPTELEQEGCACAIRDLFHGFMATLQQFDRCTVLRGVVPFLNCVRLLAYGLSFYSDEALVKSVTREGKREELLRGPLYYVIVLLIIVLVFWRDSPIGIVSLSMISGGDGFADIVGRRFGSLKLPFNDKKSWVGVAQCSYLGSCCPLCRVLATHSCCLDRISHALLMYSVFLLQDAVIFLVAWLHPCQLGSGDW